MHRLPLHMESSPARSPGSSVLSSRPPTQVVMLPGLHVPRDVDAESKLHIPEILSPWKIPGHFTTFSRAIPSPLCQGGHCHPPGTPVIHSQAQRADCPAPGHPHPRPCPTGHHCHVRHAPQCLSQHGADMSPCEVSQEKSETQSVLP